MKTVSNSYYQAILEATFDCQFPQYSDLWRCYHLTALTIDSDYCSFDEKESFLTTTQEEEKTLLGGDKKLYVPVTRKVILTGEKK